MIDSCQGETEVPLHLDGRIPSARELQKFGFRKACGRFSRLTRQRQRSQTSMIDSCQGETEACLETTLPYPTFADRPSERRNVPSVPGVPCKRLVSIF